MIRSFEYKGISIIDINFYFSTNVLKNFMMKAGFLELKPVKIKGRLIAEVNYKTMYIFDKVDIDRMLVA